MTTPWAKYIRSSKLHPPYFYPDRIHANEYSEQVLGKVITSFLVDHEMR